MDARLRRVNKEIADCKKDSLSNISIELVDDNPFHLIGSFPGPQDTPYEGGRFSVDIVIPDSYPFQPVKMKFITKVYHPNISSASGAICLDILKDAWTPVLTLKSTLISLQSLLCSPEPNDPQDAEVAKHYLTSRSSFNDTARYWTEIYADGPVSKKSAPRDEVAIAGLEKAHVDQFEALGFERGKVIDVLRRLNYRAKPAFHSQPKFLVTFLTPSIVVMRPTLVRRTLGNLVPPKIATPTSVSTGGTSASTATVVDFYSKLPKGPLPATPASGIKARYFDGKNASGKPIVVFIAAMMLGGYTLDYHMHLKHHKHHQH
ncbi:hypothetical protein FRB99_006602 [Tulasnella sp. 403]|nr:hypothetical protein FRB99_006602 [Tulasnella sp. 403]